MPGNPKVKADLALLEDLDAELVLSMFEEGRSKADICRGLGIGRRALDRWIDENDYHYAGRGTIPTLAVWLLGCVVSWASGRESRGGGRA